MTRIWQLAFVFAASISLFNPGYQLCAQAITARVVGTVTDPSGGAVPRATLTLMDVETRQTRTTRTNAVGTYDFAFLPVGFYTLSIEAAGFQETEVSQFELSLDQVARLDIELQVGRRTDQVVVQASAIALQTEEATVGTVIDAQQVLELPLDGRSFVQLALLTPGVNPGTPGSITVRRNRGSLGQQIAMSANGARDTQNRFYYDGIEAMDLDSYNFSFSLSIDAINEFKVATSTYSAEIGGAPGGQVNVMTRSGSNAFHGALWEATATDGTRQIRPNADARERCAGYYLPQAFPTAVKIGEKDLRLL
jgi:hypothetical protein